MIKRTKYVFNSLFEKVDISDWNEPMNTAMDDSELSLLNPYSKASCLVLYLYSMELGNPQLYAEANRVVRDMDLSLLKELGPFIKALEAATMFGEKYKHRNDVI